MSFTENMSRFQPSKQEDRGIEDSQYVASQTDLAPLEAGRVCESADGQIRLEYSTEEVQPLESVNAPSQGLGDSPQVEGPVVNAAEKAAIEGAECAEQE